MSKNNKKYNTYIILTRKTVKGTQSLCTGRYAVGAKNEKEAIKIIRDKIGKLNKYSMYYKSTENYMDYKNVAEETYENGKRILVYI